MKQLLFTLVFAVFALSSSAQLLAPAHLAVSIGSELTIPGNSSYQLGIGASVKLEFPIAKRMSISATGNFTHVFDNSNVIFGGDEFIPIKLGVRYYPISSLYVEGEGGVTLKTDIVQQQLATFSIGSGVIAPLGKHGGLDMGFRYESWGGLLKQPIFRLAYRYGW